MNVKEFIKNVLKPTGYTISKIPEYDVQREKQITFQNFLDLYFSFVDTEDFFFVEIGANDGITNDYLYPYVTKYNLKGIVVELQEEVFKQLEENYRAYQNVICVNVAIDTVNGVRTYYQAKDSVKTDQNYTRITGLTTFNKEVLRHTLENKLSEGSNVDENIVEKKTSTTTLNNLLQENKISKFDFLQLDCEGSDYEIIKNLDFKKFSPKIINFESNHFPSESERQECQRLLEKNGYKWFRHSIDTCAYKVS